MQITIDVVLFRESSQRQVMFNFLVVSESAIKFNRIHLLFELLNLPSFKIPQFYRKRGYQSMQKHVGTCFRYVIYTTV